MADLDLILEAERRGILPEDKKGLLAEARSRGLVPEDEPEIEAPIIETTEPGAGEYLLDRAKSGVSGFMGASGDVADLIRDAPFIAGHPALIPLSVLATGLVERLGLRPSRERLPTERVIATSKTYRDLLGYRGLKTENDAMRYAGGVVEMGAAGGPLIAAQGVRALPLITSTFGGGIGLEAGGDVAEGVGLPRPAGEALGMLTGGVTPSLSGSFAQGGVGWLRRKFSPSAQREAATSAVGREVAPLATAPTAQVNLERSLDVSGEFAAAGREFTPSLPARTASPGLLAMEKELVSRNPQALEKAVANVERNESEIAAFVNAKFPGGRETSVQRIAQLQRQAAAKLEAQSAALDEKLDQVAAVFERNPNNYEAGQKVRGLLFRQKELYRAQRNQKFEDVYEASDRLGAKANLDEVVAYTDDVLKADLNAYQQSEIPSVFRQLRDKFLKKPEGGPTIKTTPTGKEIKFYGGEPAARKPADVSFEELHSLYKRANSDIASLRGSQAPDRDFKLMLLGKVKDSLQAKLATFEEAGFGEVATKLREANRFYRDEYLPRFKQGFGDDIAARHGTGEFRVPNQEVIGMITKSNNAQAAKDFKLLFDDVPEAWASLRDGYLDMLFRDKNVLNAAGKIDQKALDRFLRQHSQTLREFPQVGNEFKQLALDNRALLERQARVLASQKELAAADLYVLFSGRDSTVVISEAVGDANAMRLLVHKARAMPRGTLAAFLGREFGGNAKKAAAWAESRAGAVEGAGGEAKAAQYRQAAREVVRPTEASSLARAIAEDVTKQSDPVAYFAQNRDTIRLGLGALGPDHFKNLEIAIDAMTINQRSRIPTSVQASGVAPDSIAASIGSSPRAIISHYINVSRGRTGLNQEATAFLGRWFDKLRRDHKAVAMEAIFYDKDAARAIANLAKQAPSPKLNMEFANAMATLGLRAEIAGQE